MTKAINHNTNNKDNTVGVPPTSPKAHQKANVKNDIKQDITNKIIALMEAGPEAWQQTWSDAAAAGMPTNATTGAPYRGVNVLLLWSHRIEQGYTSNRWMTYRQASAAGAQVRKGEKSITCVYFEMIKKNKEEGEREFFPMIRAFSLFNLNQIDNVPAELMDPETDTPQAMEFFRHEKAEQFLTATGARIDHNGHRAFYRSSTDHIILPEREAFITPANYYATACHELTHWTGHEGRLDRDFSKSSRFGDEHYAFEELVAELGASFLCGHFGFIDATVENHASYLASWIKVLKNCRRHCKNDPQGVKIQLPLTKRQERHFHRGQTCQQRVRLPHDADRTRHRKRATAARRVITKTAPTSLRLGDVGKNGTVCEAITADIPLDLIQDAAKNCHARTMDKHQNPQFTARLLISMASTEATMHFVACAIQQYFLRITQASTKKLVRHGLRPIIAPMVAEASLQRVENVNYSAAWLHALIADDMETAELAWRAVTFYAARYADMDLIKLQEEIGSGASRIKDTARLLTICVS